MTKIKAWISALRLRTLPLALSTVMMGGFLATAVPEFKLSTVVMSIITTLLLQILSNLANDYGDGTKGTDNTERIGPERAVQSGVITAKEMKAGIVVFSILSLVCGLILIWISLRENFLTGLLFFMLGIAAIMAAIKYTVGKSAYGYSGFGDIFVFIFFGIIAVCGTFFLATQRIDAIILLPAATMGLLSTGVLNLNNMRDADNDQKSGKNTIALKLGYKNARLYHYILIVIALILLPAYSWLSGQKGISYLYIALYPLFVIDLIKIGKITDKKLLDPYLRKLAVLTLLLTIIFGMGITM